MNLIYNEDQIRCPMNLKGEFFLIIVIIEFTLDFDFLLA